MITINVMTKRLRLALNNRRYRERNPERERSHSKGRKKAQCIRGHITVSPDSRYKAGGCKVCCALLSKEHKSVPEIKARENAHARRRRYQEWGWTPEMFDQTLLEQGNVCALCRKPFTKKDPACPDHKHSSIPEPRGVLHLKCNTGIGMFRDDPEMLRAAIEYVMAWA
jgi:hypothetical protein